VFILITHNTDTS